jgi:hypothetical protein
MHLSAWISGVSDSCDTAYCHLKYLTQRRPLSSVRYDRYGKYVHKVFFEINIFRIGEEVVPKGTLIISSLYSVNMDPSHFEDPAAFRPQRFLDSQVSGTVCIREYWMIYRGPGFLAVIGFGSSHTHFPPNLVKKLSLFLSLSVWLAGSAYWRERGRRGWERSQFENATARKRGLL